MSYLRFEPPQPERMDFYETQMQRAVTSRPSRHKGKRLTEDQVRLLEKSFGSNKKLDPERKFQLAVELGVPPRQVAIWYQNKRARWKTQTLEIDYNALQEKLQSAIAEKRELERDVERLRAELRNAHDMLALAGLNHHQVPEPDDDNNNKVIAPSSCSNNNLSWSSEFGGGISATNNSFDDHRHVIGCWEEEDQTLHFDDLYACLMFGSGSSPSDC